MSRAKRQHPYKKPAFQTNPLPPLADSAAVERASIVAWLRVEASNYRSDSGGVCPFAAGVDDVANKLEGENDDAAAQSA